MLKIMKKHGLARIFKVFHFYYYFLHVNSAQTLVRCTRCEINDIHKLFTLKKAMMGSCFPLFILPFTVTRSPPGATDPGLSTNVHNLPRGKY